MTQANEAEQTKGLGSLLAQKLESAARTSALLERVAELEKQLVAEAAKTAAEKLRADQMTEQHRMQAAMHAQATECLRHVTTTWLEELGFKLEKRAGVWVVQEDAGGCYPANLTERVLWKALVGRGSRPPTSQGDTDSSRRWDHIKDVLVTLKAMSKGEWGWSANSRCKYIEIRIDTRSGHCILYDRDRIRITPEQLAFQGFRAPGRPWQPAAPPKISGRPEDAA